MLKLKNQIAVAVVAAALITAAAGAAAELPDDVKREQADCEKQNLGACQRLVDFFLRQNRDGEAQPFLKTLCGAAIESACLRLGTYDLQVLDDKKAALAWFRKACLTPTSKGEGCYHVGKLAAAMDSKTNAAHWYKRACDQGYEAACKVK